ncbi:GNAT family N-acetyltransferase [Streptomyces sp. NBC_00378]|uniref:GNAT family N-acetyltransferase n=1 Tax=unclassified Streptomyces TaxID=2593676 RepID=UPI00224E1015|nr:MULTISPECIES: GNAT family N-acetyltransferase [unclassified Streptomyces]MCX5109230.1 GNAT family N-acetyltransferase [Streptomyces sp. NBC_00378]
MDDALARIMTASAHGRFPPPDGSTTVVRQPSARDAGVLAFTAHSVVFTDEDPDWVRAVLARTPGDELAATMNPHFLNALLARTGRHMNTVDLLTVAPALPGEPEIELREIEDPEHPRVARAMQYRDEVRVWSADGGVVILGRGVAGRWETAIEVAEEARGRRLGERLARAARQLVPDAVVWAQQSPGNARSVRTFQAAGYRPVGSEALFVMG